VVAIPSEIARVVADAAFCGTIRVGPDDASGWAAAYGSASRRFGVANRPDTSFAIASGTKGFTALTIMSLVDEGLLTLATTARSVLCADLPLINDQVNIEHLLAQRSGIGDYLDENAGSSIHDYVMPVPVHQLCSTEAYLPVLDGHPQVRAPDEQFEYCNSGYVVLALIAERVTGRSFSALVQERVCRPAEMAATRFARGDAPPEGSAEGYLVIDGEWRTNVLHLPLLGSGDGGMYATTEDLAVFWPALFGGRIVSEASLAAVIHPRSDVPAERRRYGMGFWLHRTSSVVMLEGLDAGISFRSVHDPASGRTLTTISNTVDGAWPVTAALERFYGLD
jgi:CubicO group peptidase (beta-lactamase class C family)